MEVDPCRGGHLYGTRAAMKPILVLPMEESVECETEAPLSKALLISSLKLPMACGGRGMCATCHVHVADGAEHLSALSAMEQRTLGRITGCSPKSRLACQARVNGPVSVSLPNGIYIETEQQLELLVGKRAERDILHPADGRVLVRKGQIVSRYAAKAIVAAGLRTWEGQ
jgi:ferredoxin